MRCSMDIISLIQLALQVGNPDHHEQVLPHVGCAQLERFANGAWSAQLGARDLAILGPKNALTLERIKVLCERATECPEVISLDDEG